MHALIGAQRVNLNDMRLFWKIQDRIDLSPEERELIGFQQREINGMQQVGWDASKSIPEKEYDFSTEEITKLSEVINQWQSGYMVQSDRVWLEPLLQQLEISTNGHKP